MIQKSFLYISKIKNDPGMYNINSISIVISSKCRNLFYDTHSFHDWIDQKLYWVDFMKKFYIIIIIVFFLLLKFVMQNS